MATKTLSPKGPPHSARQAYELFDAGKPVDDVAEEMGRARSTTHGYLNHYLRERKITDPNRWVKAADIEIIEAAIAEHGPAPLKPIKEVVGDAIDYATIRIVVSCWRNRHPEGELSSKEQ